MSITKWEPYPDFLLSLDHKSFVFNLSDEEAGRILKALFNYAETGEILDMSTEDRLVRTTLEAMAAKVKQNKDHYREVCEQNRINGAKGGAKRAENARLKRMEATATDC